jgi:hypothetical protein
VYLTGGCDRLDQTLVNSNSLARPDSLAYQLDEGGFDQPKNQLDGATSTWKLSLLKSTG